ncbi:MAG: hypothetical protein HY658_07405 [Actinobacteria bacterium]|nr:hypothetical protein [Actinomycetota bacterium]
MPVGELVNANVVDGRVFAAEGETGPPGVYLTSLPSRTLPFVVYRAWKVPTGYVAEEIRFTAPSGVTAYRWGPKTRWMKGSMDLTTLSDLVEDAVFREVGSYLVSFILEGEVLGEVEVPVYLQAAPEKLPKEVEEGLRRSDVIWVGVEDSRDARPKGDRRILARARLFAQSDRHEYPAMIPSWFVYRNGRIYLLSRTDPGFDEQSVPGLPDAQELVVVTRRKGRDTSLDRFRAAVRILPPGPEWEQAAGLLADKRKSRAGPPADSIKRWRNDCVIAELTPIIPT